MSDYRAMIITAVVCLGIVAWTIVWAFIIGFVADAHRPRYRRPPVSSIPAYTPYLTETVFPRAIARGETPSSVDCPVHGAGCEGWL